MKTAKELLSGCPKYICSKSLDRINRIDRIIKRELFLSFLCVLCICGFNQFDELFTHYPFLFTVVPHQYREITRAALFPPMPEDRVTAFRMSRCAALPRTRFMPQAGSSFSM